MERALARLYNGLSTFSWSCFLLFSNSFNKGYIQFTSFKWGLINSWVTVIPFLDASISPWVPHVSYIFCNMELTDLWSTNTHKHWGRQWPSLYVQSYVGYLKRYLKAVKWSNIFRVWKLEFELNKKYVQWKETGGSVLLYHAGRAQFWFAAVQQGSCAWNDFNTWINTWIMNKTTV